MINQDIFAQYRREIAVHEMNAAHTARGYDPLFAVHRSARIVIIGQAPGLRAQLSGVPWNDASGERLRTWLGLSAEVFHADPRIAHMPMDFYYPGKGSTGDLPPRTIFAPLWHPRLLAEMADIELMVLVGVYAQRYYLKLPSNARLTETVRNYHQHLPLYFPLVHPSPLNFRWFAKNPWFEVEVVPALQQKIAAILAR